MESILLVLASREEYIFQLQIIEAQSIQLSNAERASLMSNLQYKIISVEQRRIQIESQTLLNFVEPKRILQKLVKRFIKIQQFYYQKLQLYFPLFSQRQPHPVQRNQLFKIASTPQKFPAEIIQILLQLQKDRLFKSFESLLNSLSARQEPLQYDPITNRNEKFIFDCAMDHLNHIHLTYYLINKTPNRADPYEILSLEDESRETYQGSGFKSYVSCLTKTKNIFIPIETTQEILLFRFDKLQKQLMDQNNLLAKRIAKYNKIQKSPEVKVKVLKSRLSKPIEATRASYTFQEGYLTDKEPHTEIFKKITVKNIELQFQDRKFIVRDKIGKTLKLSNTTNEETVEKKRNTSNHLQSQLIITKGSKLQRISGVCQKYQLVAIKQNCSQMRISQIL